MAVYEGRAKRNGEQIPVEYIYIKQTSSRPPRLHYHEYIEILYGLTGSATVYIGTDQLKLGEGSMILIYNDEPHDVILKGKECTYHVVKFLPQILLSGEQTYSEHSYIFTLMEHTRSHRRFFPPEELSRTALASLFDHLGEEWKNQEFGYQLSLRADVTKIFLHILRRWREENPSLTKTSLPFGQRELISKALAHIHASYADITQESTAAACGVTAPYFSRVFKKAMHTTFSSYVCDIRLREAERLLLTSDISVTEIAQTVGFSTSAYFISRFRSVHGQTPHQYRKLYRR